MAILTAAALIELGKINPVLVNIQFPNGAQTDVYMLDSKSGRAVQDEMAFVQEIGAISDSHQFISSQANTTQVMAYNMIKFLCNEQGEPMFKRDELDALINLPADIIQTIGAAIHRQHTIGRMGARLKAVDKAEQNTTEQQDTADK